MTGHVVSFEPAGAPTRAVCKCGWESPNYPVSEQSYMGLAAENHAHIHRGTVELAGLPPVERAS